jgi:hypothetical protein
VATPELKGASQGGDEVGEPVLVFNGRRKVVESEGGSVEKWRWVELIEAARRERRGEGRVTTLFIGRGPGRGGSPTVMVGSFNDFGHFSIEGRSREDGVGHCFEKRRAGGAVDSASLGTEESAKGIGAVATPVESGGGGL